MAPSQEVLFGGPGQGYAKNRAHAGLDAGRVIGVGSLTDEDDATAADRVRGAHDGAQVAWVLDVKESGEDGELADSDLA